MALKHILTVGSLLAALLIGNAQAVKAQVQDIHLPDERFQHRELEKSDHTPVPTPGVFDYDAQIFAPLEFVNDKQLEPRVGFYLEYDRTFLSLSGGGRIESGQGNASTHIGDNYTWGTRYHFGWFSENDTGWAISYQQNEGNTFLGQGIGGAIANRLITTNFETVEVNRVFRQSSKHGAVLEPYGGLRYYGVTDETTEDLAFNRFRQKATNSTVGLQAGVRHSRRSGKWRFTTDGAVVAAYNQQKLSVSDVGAGGGLSGISRSSASDQSFVPSLDGEFDISYNVTRDITLKTGVQVNYLWDGINRANTLTAGLNPNSVLSGGPGATDTNSQRFIAAGFIFGFEWRR